MDFNAVKRMETHAHSMYSNIRLLDSINRPRDLIITAYKLGLSGICLTDHECLCGAVEWLELEKELKSKGEIPKDFKCGIGNEIYLVDSRDKKQKYYHFILIAKDTIGFQQLCELSSESWYNSYYDRGMERVPTLKSELREIVKHNPGHLIATSGCIAGEDAQGILMLSEAEKHNDALKAEEARDKINNFLEYCVDLFGSDFYIEVAPNNTKDQILVNKRSVNIARAFGIKMIYGCDVHYLLKQDRFIHKAYLNSKEGEREIDSFYLTAHLMDNNEAWEYLSKSYDEDTFIELCNNSMEIYNKIESYDIFRNPIIPEVEVKNYPKRENFLSQYPTLTKLFSSDNIQERYWINECWNEMEKTGWSSRENYIQRLETEANIIDVIGHKLGNCLFEYFNTFQHFIDLFWECGSLVGPGRGSSVCFLSNRLMGITQLDPIEWGLSEWRFLNTERTELPDIDTDLAPSKRPLILKKIREERGEMRVLQVATFGTEGTKSAILTACFKKGTLVMTSEGEKNIEDIQAGDFVLTDNGYEKVLAPTIYKGIPNYKIQTKKSNNGYIYCTADHQFLVVEKKNKLFSSVIAKDFLQEHFPDVLKLGSKNNLYQTYIRNCRQVFPIWKQAEQIDKNCYGLIPIDMKLQPLEYLSWENDFRKKYGVGIATNIKIDTNFCELIGIWLAEGSIGNDGHFISFTINKNEELLKKRIISLMWQVFQCDNFGIYERDDSMAMTIQYSSRQLGDLFTQLFTGYKDIRTRPDFHRKMTQWGKRVPEQLRYIDPILQLQIFKGWFLGDGYASLRDGNSTPQSKGTTVSKELCQDMVEILRRNYINPSIDIEYSKNDKCTVYNITLYSNKASRLYYLKYKSDLTSLLIFSIEDRTDKDIPVIYNGKPYLRTDLKVEKINEEEQDVFCLMMPREQFCVNDIITHNCRGYRSEEYPNGIDVDDAQYIASLIPQERGFLWSLDDVTKGNPDKDRKPISQFNSEMEKYPGLLEIIYGIDGLVNKRSQHASGVILYNDDPWMNCAVMRSPNGDLTTQFDLHRSEAMGNTKFDFLVTDICDKLTETIKLLVNDGYFSECKSLREIYNKYLHPDVLDLKDEKIWDKLDYEEVIDLFQFNTPVGGQAIRSILPRNPLEMMMANALTRLTGEKGQERPIEKYVRFKNDINQWYNECRKWGLNEEDIKILEPYYLPVHGVPTTQEKLMLLCMEPKLAHFTLAEANSARKIVAKKVTSKIPELHDKFVNQCSKQQLGEYVWHSALLPQASYAFAEPHALAYSFIAIQILALVTYYPVIYWNCACLIVNSGGNDYNEDEVIDEDENEEGDDENVKKKKVKNTNYGKVATAIGTFQSKGIKILPPDVNSSSYTFSPDVKNNSIIYGLRGITRISSDLIKKIIENRPYDSLEDFLNRNKMNKLQTLNLIKAGAFDTIEGIAREDIMHKYLESIADKKQRLTLQNMQMLINKDLIPDEMQFYAKLFLFNKFLKTCKEGINYSLNEAAINFISSNFDSDLIEDGAYIPQKTWDNLYKKAMEPMRQYLKNNKDEMLAALNKSLYDEVADKYATGNISSWEMDSISFYYHEHELAFAQPNFDDFFDLPEEPEVEYSFTGSNGQEVKMYKLHHIIGTVIDKDKVRNTINLLTPTGVVTVRIYKNQFALYDKQISEKDSDGTKHVLEKSWLSRGTKLMIQGIRRGNDYIPKKTRKSIYPVISKITGVDENNNLILQYERMEVES